MFNITYNSFLNNLKYLKNKDIIIDNNNNDIIINDNLKNNALIININNNNVYIQQLYSLNFLKKYITDEKYKNNDKLIIDYIINNNKQFIDIESYIENNKLYFKMDTKYKSKLLLFDILDYENIILFDKIFIKSNNNIQDIIILHNNSSYDNGFNVYENEILNCYIDYMPNLKNIIGDYIKIYLNKENNINLFYNVVGYDDIHLKIYNILNQNDLINNIINEFNNFYYKYNTYYIKDHFMYYERKINYLQCNMYEINNNDLIIINYLKIDLIDFITNRIKYYKNNVKLNNIIIDLINSLKFLKISSLKIEIYNNEFKKIYYKILSNKEILNLLCNTTYKTSILYNDKELEINTKDLNNEDYNDINKSLYNLFNI